MISYEEACQSILAQTSVLEAQTLSLTQLSGYVLAMDVIAPFDLPLFDQSAMDGFGVRAKDVESATKDHPVVQKVQETVQAGDTGNLLLLEGCAVKILTGAPIPPGVDAVIMKEFCEEEGNTVRIQRPVNAGENIRCHGEEFKAGEIVLPTGHRITPPVVGLLATLGYAEFSVYRKPKVAILVTGNELVPPGESLVSGQIYDSNSYALMAALGEAGIFDCAVFRVRDDRDETRTAFEAALAEADVVLTVGGVSVGDFDFVKEVVETSGVQTVFWRIAMKPGKPVYFGVKDVGKDRKLVIGLPGNPVSALVTYHQLAQPALLKMMGIQGDQAWRCLQATLTHPLRKKAGRMELVRGVLSCEQGRFKVTATRGQDSHMLGGLSRANCLIHFPEDAERLSDGEDVAVELLYWN